jgi:radical SAM superfamily enzyme YgiQ (UPF0313 family)
MSNNELVSIGNFKGSTKSRVLNEKILLVKPPFFTPWTPPLGIAILKSYLEQNGYAVTCYDFNTEVKLWTTHHKYFTELQKAEGSAASDGYSKMWFILNAHFLAYLNGADRQQIARILEIITPLYGIQYEPRVSEGLIPIVEAFFQRMEEIVDELDMSEYSVVGTSTYTTSLSASLFFLRRAKEKNPQIKTVMGGGVFADDLATGSDNLVTLLEEYPYVDHVVLGEGEKLFLKLLDGELAHKRMITLADLKGASLEMKDVPAPDFSDLPSENYYHLSIEGARSCPFQCSFCSETIQWGDYRKKPIDMFANQVIELADTYGNNSFFLGDSLMNPYINPFATALIEKKANILYDGYLRADKPVTNRKFVKLWTDSGLYRARLGIESASARTLGTMDKMTTPQVISDVLKRLANAGVRTTTYWIVGFPGETEEDFLETYNFIRTHHQYIYELEAHPYYFYPYGQIGSRLYQAVSLFPEEVTRFTKFRIWEVVDADPVREERYHRLRRISDLAVELGLPNIYTMVERYAAEDRWHLLYPLAAEIYEGTRMHREEVSLSESPVEVFAREWRRQPAANGAALDSVLCYHTSVSKRLDETTLALAAEQLIENNEMLQMSLRDGKYVGMEAADDEQESLVAVYQSAAVAGSELDALITGNVQELAAQLKPRRGSSVRVALIQNGDEASELVLLAHQAIADSKSVVLLFEDLFRIYESLANEREVSLRPVEKSYTEFINELTEANASIFTDSPASGTNGSGHNGSHAPRADTQSKAESGESEPTVISLDELTMRQLSNKFLEANDMKLAELLVAATLKCLAEMNKKESVDVDVVYDYRWIDTSLKHTAASLTATYHLPSVNTAPDNSHSYVQEIRRTLRELPADGGAARATSLASDSASQPRVLLNLGYFQEEPWLGGDEWSPRGFLRLADISTAPYSLEIVPVFTGATLEVHLKGQNGEEARKMTGLLTENLASELQTALANSQQLAAAV